MKNPETQVKLIFNPNAGKKRHPVGGSPITPQDIKALFDKYQIPVDLFPTKGPGDANRLASQAKREKYDVVVAAGGDGTVSEVANGLIGTEIALGILPTGSVMNTVRMLAIPHDMEKAVMLFKINRRRKIDVGQITLLSGVKPKSPIYFMESSSVGIEAELMDSAIKIEHGHYREFLGSLKSLVDYYRHRVKIVLDDKTLERRVMMVSVSNGNFSGVALQLAPKARLNDHQLNVSIFEMSKKELAYYFLKFKGTGQTGSSKISHYQSTKVAIYTRLPKPVHVDAQVFGTTPVEYEILPNALTVITGFPESGDPTLEKRTRLDPSSNGKVG